MKSREARFIALLFLPILSIPLLFLRLLFFFFEDLHFGWLELDGFKCCEHSHISYYHSIA
jgi:hypothetical protein